MCRDGDQPPDATTWDVLIMHGVHPTVGGPIGGWGWICRNHPKPDGMHGYPTLIDALNDLVGHVQRCPGG